MEAMKQRCNKLEHVGFSHYTEIINEYNRSQHEVTKLIVAENGVDMMSMKTIENELIKVRFYLLKWKNGKKCGSFFSQLYSPYLPTLRTLLSTERSVQVNENLGWK